MTNRIQIIIKAYRIKINSVIPSPSLPLPNGDVVELVVHFTPARHQLVQEQQWGLGVDGLAQLEGGALSQGGCDILRGNWFLLGHVAHHTHTSLGVAHGTEGAPHAITSPSKSTETVLWTKKTIVQRSRN